MYIVQCGISIFISFNVTSLFNNTAKSSDFLCKSCEQILNSYYKVRHMA